MLTFTDRAAREMKSRILAAFDALELEVVRRQTETAYISTVHSLCARLLRSHTLEARVDPSFTVLDEHEARRLLRQAFFDELEQAAAAENSTIFDIVDAMLDSSEFSGSDLYAAPRLQRELAHLMRRMQGSGWNPADAAQELSRREQGSDPVTRMLKPVLARALRMSPRTSHSSCLGTLRRGRRNTLCGW